MDEKIKYKSCHDLENGIILFSEGIKHCCNLNSNGILQETICYSDSIEKTIRTVIEKKEQLIRDNIHGKQTFCTGCKYLREGYWSTQKQIKQINISLDYSCNLKCKYCNKWGPKYVNKNRILIPELMHQLKDNNQVNLIYPVLYSSGEITIQPELDAIVDSLNEFDVCFFSNATQYQQKIAQKIKLNHSFLVVSLDCGCRKTYQKIKGVDLFDDVCCNIKKYRAEGGNVFLKYILTNDNIGHDDLKGFIKVCLEKHISSIIISRDFHSKIIDKAIRKAASYLAYLAMKENIRFFTDGVYDIYKHVFDIDYNI